jgi:hypothetical protein
MQVAGERVLVGRAPHLRPFGAARCPGRTAGAADLPGDQLTSGLALLAAIVALLAAIWWTACSPVL